MRRTDSDLARELWEAELVAEAERQRTSKPVVTGAKSATPPTSTATPPPPRSSASTCWGTVREAAAELGRHTGRSSSAPPRVVRGPFPPPASSTGGVYYVFSNGPGAVEPAIAAGQGRALLLHGGSWVGHGQCPARYGDPHSALNAAHAILKSRPGAEFIKVYAPLW